MRQINPVRIREIDKQVLDMIKQDKGLPIIEAIHRALRMEFREYYDKLLEEYRGKNKSNNQNY